MSRPRTVLVVDDDPRVRSILRRALESEGSSVLEAATEHEALDLFSKAVVDLVTLDLEDTTLRAASLILA